MSETFELPFVCARCGAPSATWMARCPRCNNWNKRKPEFGTEPQRRDLTPRPDRRAALERTPDPSAWTPDAAASPTRPESVPVPITEVDLADFPRTLSGIESLDRVLGGGIVQDSLILLSGDPGIGKSTLVAQLLAALPYARMLYATAEETPGQVALRAQRVGGADPRIGVVMEPNLEHVITHAVDLGAQFLVVDSVQKVHMPGVGSPVGSAHQVRACAARLMKFAKAGVTTLIIGHINKDGDLAGPKTLEHDVDVVLQFEQDDEFEAIRHLRCHKNRYGTTAEIGSFEMREEGLVAIATPDRGPDAERPVDQYLPIAQELLHRFLELGGVLDDALRDRIGSRLDLTPRGGA